MLFTSFTFLIFLPVVFILYWFFFNKKLSIQNLLLLIASYVFYGSWSLKFLLLLVLSTVMDYFYGFGVASPSRKRAKLFLWLSIINNLGFLCVFKYYNFFLSEVVGFFEFIRIHINPEFIKVAVPLGISFYTFHGLSYVFDIYRKKQKPVSNFVEYAVFVSFFPLLIAGPIERANHLLPQVRTKRVFTYGQAVEGCRLILWGLFKKVVIADSLASCANAAFENYHSLSGIELITGAIAFSFQIYCDFSGYSDIAIGIAKLFGFELLSNFRFPYFSRDIAEFWRRWHISLSSWFKDYLYIPLGGSKLGKWTTIKNIFIVFLISGFWHGANWTFLAWGLIHAFGFLLLLLLGKNRENISTVAAQNALVPGIRESFKITVTFSFVTLAWIFFRSATISDSFGFIGKCVSSIWADPWQLFSMSKIPKALFLILPLMIIDWFFRLDERHLRMPKNKLIRRTLYILIALIIYAFLGKSNTFIYFQF